jgi:hypothetical protein
MQSFRQGETGKVKVKAILTHKIQACEGSEGKDPLIVTSVLDGDEWSASQNCRFSPEE